MKKLIILAVVGVMATIANAATVTWSATAASMTLPEGCKSTSVVAYLFEGKLDQATLQTALNAGTWTGAGNLSNKTQSPTSLLMVSGLGDYLNKTVDFTMILFDNSTIATSDQYKMANVSVVFTDKNNFANFTNTLTAAEWTAINVPEPTSGLLMLLGMAGLALRRRRA